MKILLYCRVTLLITFAFVSFSRCYGETIVPFTQEDRNHLIQIEEKLNSQQRQIDDLKTGLADIRQEIKDIRQEIKDVKSEILNFFYWGFGIVIAMILALFGYIVWDRRTAIMPVELRTRQVEEKYRTLVQVLKDLAKEQPKLADILHINGIL